MSTRKEVILAAGGVQTPQILELSGIGSRDIIHSAGIHHIVENVRVGEQFVDHPVTILSYDLVNGETYLDLMTHGTVLSQASQKYRRGE